MIGKTISHYKIVEKLGEGGMGVVYRARDTRLDRDVAIKLLPAHLNSDPEAVNRFVHEAKAASALNHSAIGVIHEIDETESGQTFIVMALYEGGTLRDKIDGGKMTPEETIAIASQIASGLAAAHEKGIVHRDIKPQNILLTREGEAKIIDFGLAKLAGRTRLTREGSTMGTAAYMSPEQARGEDVDHRSDIFSLGTILYEMLAGEPPFRGEHEAALLYEIVNEEPEEISDKSGNINPQLYDIIGKMLKKDPSERYQSARQLKDELIATGSSSLSGSAFQKSNRRSSIRGWMPVAVLVVLMSVVAVFAFKSWFSPGKMNVENLTLAVIDFRDLGGSEDSRLAKSLTSLLNKGLIEPCPIRVVSEEMVQYSRRKMFGNSYRPIEAHQAIEIAERSKAVYFISGEVNEIEGKRFAAWSLVEVRTGDNIIGGTARGENLFAVADIIIDESVNALNGLLEITRDQTAKSVTEVTTGVPEAYNEYMMGLDAWENYSHHEAIKHFDKAVQLDSTFALAYLALSKVIFDSGKRGGAVFDYADLAVRYSSRVSPKDRLRIEIWKKNYGGGNASFSEIIASYEQILKFWPDDIDAYREISMICFYEWYFADAARFAERGLEYYPDDYLLRSRFAWSLNASGRNKLALQEGLTNVRLFPDNKNEWDNLGLFYIASAMPDSADWAFRRALNIDPEFVWSLHGLAFSEYCRGDIDLSVERIEMILKNIELGSGAKRHLLVNMRQEPGLAFFHAEAGCYGKAMEMFKQASHLVSSFRERTRLERERFWLLERMGQGEEMLRISNLTLSDNEDSLYALTNGLMQRAHAYAALDSFEDLSETLGESHSLIDYAGGYLIFFISLFEAEVEAGREDYNKAIARLNKLDESMLGSAGGLEVYVWEKVANYHEKSGNYDAAIDKHKDILYKYGGHALSHYDLGRLNENGHPEEAKRHYKRFLAMWKNADEDLPQPDYARKRLAALGSI